MRSPTESVYWRLSSLAEALNGEIVSYRNQVRVIIPSHHHNNFLEADNSIGESDTNFPARLTVIRTFSHRASGMCSAAVFWTLIPYLLYLLQI